MNTRTNIIDDHAVIDVLTSRTAIVRPDRQVIGCSTGLIDAYRYSATRGVRFTIVTDTNGRLTMPTRSLLALGGGQWVIESSDGSYDGLTGEHVRWQGDSFVDEHRVEPHPAFLHRDESLRAQLVISMTVQHRATASALVGGALAVLSEHLAGAPPRGWGPHEPVSQPWDQAELTELVRSRMPEPTRLIAVGDQGSPMIATVSVTRTANGIDEDIMAVLPAGDPPEASSAATETLLRIARSYPLGIAMAQLSRGLPDMTTGPTFAGVNAPIALALGPRAVRDIGRDRLESSSLGAPRRVGPPRLLPSLVWDLPAQTSWQLLTDLLAELGPDRLAGWSDDRGHRRTDSDRAEHCGLTRRA
jgi:hypothetical protein